MEDEHGGGDAKEYLMRFERNQWTDDIGGPTSKRWVESAVRWSVEHASQCRMRGARHVACESPT